LHFVEIQPPTSDAGGRVAHARHADGGCRTAVEEFLSERPDFSFENGDNVILRKVGG